MLVSIALIVLISSIVVFFAREFGELFKKIFKIPGLKLLLPLFVASTLLIVYEVFVHWLLLRLQKIVHQLIVKLATILPFEKGALFIARIILLFMIGSLPIWIEAWSDFRKTYKEPHSGIYWIGMMLWIITAVLLTVAYK